MKLLLDQNLSYKLTNRLQDIYPGSQHVRLLGMQDEADRAIWEYARENDYVIVSKDEDFHQLSFLHGPPPKVIWVKLGNCSALDQELALRSHYHAIMAFIEDLEGSFMIINEVNP